MTREDFAREQTRCWICGWTGSHINPLTTHEIARGPAREAALKEPAAWFCACQLCHMGILDSMPIAEQLGIKALEDPENYDRVKVNLLRHRARDAISENEVIIEAAKHYQRIRQRC